MLLDCCLVQGWKYIMKRRDGVGINKLRFNGSLLGKADTVQETQGDIKLGIAQEWKLTWNSSSMKYWSSVHGENIAKGINSERNGFVTIINTVCQCCWRFLTTLWGCTLIFKEFCISSDILTVKLDFFSPTQALCKAFATLVPYLCLSCFLIQSCCFSKRFVLPSLPYSFAPSPPKTPKTFHIVSCLGCFPKAGFPMHLQGY